MPKLAELLIGIAALTGGPEKPYPDLSSANPVRNTDHTVSYDTRQVPKFTRPKAQPKATDTSLPDGIAVAPASQEKSVVDAEKSLAAGKLVDAVKVWEKLPLDVRSAALANLMANGDKRFAELAFHLAKSDPDAVTDGMLKIAAWRKPQALVEAFESVASHPGANIALLWAFERDGERSKDAARDLFKMTESKPLREAIHSVIDLHQKVSDLPKFTPFRVAAILSDKYPRPLEDEAFTIIMNRPGSSKALLSGPNTEPLTIGKKLEVLRFAIPKCGAEIEGCIETLNKTSEGRAFIDSILVPNYTAENANTDFDKKCKDLFPKLTKYSLETVASAVVEKGEKEAELVLQRVSQFSSCAEAFVKVAALYPGLYERHLEKMAMLDAEIRDACDQYHQGARFLLKIAEKAAANKQQELDIKKLKSFKPVVQALVLFGISDCGAAGAELLLKNYKTVLAMADGPAALDRAAKQQPSVFIKNHKQLSETEDGKLLLAIARAEEITNKIVANGSVIDVKKVDLQLARLNDENVSHRVGLWITRNGGAPIVIELNRHFTGEAGARLLGEAINEKPYAAFELADSFTKHPKRADMLQAALMSAANKVALGEFWDTKNPPRLLAGISPDHAGLEKLFKRLKQGKLLPEDNSVTLEHVTYAFNLSKFYAAKDLPEAQEAIKKLPQADLQSTVEDLLEQSPIAAHLLFAIAGALDSSPQGVRCRHAVLAMDVTGFVSHLKDVPDTEGGRKLVRDIGYQCGLAELHSQLTGAELGMVTETLERARAGEAKKDWRLAQLEMGARDARATISSMARVADRAIPEIDINPEVIQFARHLALYAGIKYEWYPLDCVLEVARFYAPRTFSLGATIQSIDDMRTAVLDVTDCVLRNLSRDGKKLEESSFKTEFKNVVELRRRYGSIPLVDGKDVVWATAKESLLDEVLKNMQAGNPGALPLPATPFRTFKNGRDHLENFDRPGAVKAFQDGGAKSVTIVRTNPLRLSQFKAEEKALGLLEALPSGGRFFLNKHGFNKKTYFDGGALVNGIPTIDLYSTWITSEQYAQCIINDLKTRKSAGETLPVKHGEQKILFLLHCRGSNNAENIFEAFKKLAQKEGIPLEAFPIIVSAASSDLNSYSDYNSVTSTALLDYSLEKKRKACLGDIIQALPRKTKSNPKVYIVVDGRLMDL